MPDRGTNFGISAIIRDCLATHPLGPLPLAREGGRLPRVGKRGVKPLSINLFPLSFEGEGDKGGEVSKYSYNNCVEQDIKACIIMIVRS